MQLKRTAMFACGGAAVAAWLAAASTTGVQAPPPVPRDAASAAPADVGLAEEVARLHERLAPAAAPVHPGRDLFRFATDRARRAPAASPRPTATVEAPAAAPLPAIPARPAVKLDGIAADLVGDATVRTAILSTQGQLILAKEGDLVTTRYKVVRISEDVVELLDLVENTILRLPLR